ncbi:hypothetical protein BDV34DRAFT_219267 [Aspergillus parasiticus]|uniref:Uncharacterized protein n=1 Tax=Aspergillus parasiticus TaxID=5067 RepID=A0A5N6E598_ASPPA|nr:hypothetical protein BDV34DRAFT_219267 [Aspergillus parasiticus]
MSDAAVPTSSSSFYGVSYHGLGHNPTNPFPMHNDLGFPVRDFNMEPLPPNSAVMQGSPFHYPPWQLGVPLHEGSIVPGLTVDYDLEVGPNLHRPTSFQSDQIATAGYSYGHLPSNTPLTPHTLPVEPQSMEAQQETRASNHQEGYDILSAVSESYDRITNSSVVEGTTDLRRDVDGRAVRPQNVSTARPTFCGMLELSILLLGLTGAM